MCKRTNQEQIEIIARNLRVLMSSHNLSQVDISRIAMVSESAVSNWLSGRNAPSMGSIERIATHLGVRKSDILEIHPSAKNLVKLSHIRRIPIIGTIACGTPILAEENYQGYFTVDDLIKADFCLFAKGDSMIDANIFDGDIVFIKQTPVVENGTIAAVVIGDEATLKRVYLDDNHLVLQPANKNYSPLVYSEDDAKDKNIMVIGEMVGIYHEVNKNR